MDLFAFLPFYLENPIAIYDILPFLKCHQMPSTIILQCIIFGIHCFLLIFATKCLMFVVPV
jgi:hypothetical protein